MDTYNKAHSKWPATGEVLDNNKDNLGSSGLLWRLRFGHRRQGEGHLLTRCFRVAQTPSQPHK